MNQNILAFCLLVGLSLTTQAQESLYTHSHQGTQAQKENRDTNFGSPASYHRGNLYRRNYSLQLSGKGVDRPRKLSVEQRSVANFDLQNLADKDLYLLIGDAKAIAESAQLIRNGHLNDARDFHLISVKAGQSSQFAWRFDTFATQQLDIAVIDASGNMGENVLKVKVGPRVDRNAHLAGN